MGDGTGTEISPGELLDFRAGLGLSQSDLASLLGVGQPAVNRWEKGARSIPGRLRQELGQILADFEEDRAAVVAGGSPSVGAPWERAARFWGQGYGRLLGS